MRSFSSFRAVPGENRAGIPVGLNENLSLSPVPVCQVVR